MMWRWRALNKKTYSRYDIRTFCSRLHFVISYCHKDWLEFNYHRTVQLAKPNCYFFFSDCFILWFMTVVHQQPCPGSKRLTAINYYLNPMCKCGLPLWHKFILIKSCPFLVYNAGKLGLTPHKILFYSLPYFLLLHVYRNVTIECNN